jgi:tetratricopeptide (TPR) repeat protein
MSEEQLQLFRDRIAEFEKQAADNESAGTRDISVILQLGNLNYTMGELGTAAKWYRDILSTNPNDGPAHENLGQTLLEMGDYAGAEQEWRLALNVSAYEPIYLKLVELIAEHFPERQAEIQVILETAIANLGQTPGLLTRLGEWYADNGLYEEAVSHYEVASKLDPDDKAIEQRLKELRRLRVQQVP